jgi:hypothetical protein
MGDGKDLAWRWGKIKKNIFFVAAGLQPGEEMQICKRREKKR